MKDELFRRDAPLVLIVDDDEAMRLLERESLERAGFLVEEAQDGVEAVASYKRHRPDIVLLDVMMPGMDGFAVCAELRKIKEGALLPILMVTGLEDTESINRAYEVGATDFITKPINWGLLGHRVRYMLRSSRAFNELGISEWKNRALLNAMPDMMFRISREGTLLEFRGTGDAGLLQTAGDFLGRRLHEVFPSEIARRAMHYVELTLLTGEMQFFEYEVLHKGVRHFYEARIVASGGDEVLSIVRNMTERKKAEEQIIRLAYYDGLTGLPNRLLFKDRIRQAIAYAKRYGKMVATVFLDLDRFKRINDTFGHNVGDLLLQGVADRLTQVLRGTDSVGRPGADEFMPTIARLGGDEFTILLTDFDSVQDIAKVARRLLHEVARTFVIEGNELFVTTSIGIALYPFDGDDVDTLLKNADAAMYHAKDLGRNNVQFYTRSMNTVAFERLVMESSLSKAVERGEFQLYYQPQFDIKKGCIVGLEALLRWRHPELGIISPSEFVPLAEELGLIVPIGGWVLRTACSQMICWKSAGVPLVRVSVNLTGHQLQQQGLVKMVEDVLRETAADPRCLEFELTESMIMRNADAAIVTLNDLKALGLGLSIDDFGTGYSSLSYLKRLPLDALKIDRSFVKDVTTDPDDAAITEAIIAMANRLKLRVIAEGVETEQQLAFLRRQGCDEVQGFFLSPPLSAEDIIGLLREDPPANQGVFSR